MAFKSPAETWGTCGAIGRIKTEVRLSDLVVLGFLPGACVAFAGLYWFVYLRDEEHSQ